MTRRLYGAAAALVALSLAVPAAAQNARAAGIVRDTNGRPIRGALVRATNPTAHPSEMASTTDDKGRWAMIGLSTGQWHFAVDAPGFASTMADLPIRVAASPPLTFTLARELGPLPGALDKDVQQQIASANALRDEGRLDQAIAAYGDIRSKNPKLTAVSLVLGDAYRKKATQERDPAVRRTLLTQALTAYTDALKGDDTNERAKVAVDAARSDLGGNDGSIR